MSDPKTPLDKSGGAPDGANDSADNAEALQRQRALTVRLRDMFDEVAQEPVPGSFLDLLKQLDEKEGPK